MAEMVVGEKLGLEGKNSSLEDLYDPGCSKCPLGALATNICVPGMGPLNADLMVIGEAPGGQEDIYNEPFRGPAGKALKGFIKDAGWDLDNVYFANVVKCVPHVDGGLGTPQDEHIVACIDYLWGEIDAVRPKVIVPVGRIATGALLNKWSIGKTRGAVYNMDFTLDDNTVIQFPVVPTWHPSYVIRGNLKAGYELVSDLVLAKSVIDAESEGVDERQGIEFAYVNDFETLIDYVDMLLDLHRSGKLQYGLVACDIESDDIFSNKAVDGPKPFSLKTNIVSIQFSWADNLAILIPVIRDGSVFNSAIGIKVLRVQLKRIFDEIPIGGQNFTYDYKAIRIKLGLTVKNLVFDTKFSHYMLFCGFLPSDLDFLITRYLCKVSHKKELENFMNSLPKEERSFANVPTKLLVRYGCGDTDSTLRLCGVFKKMLKEMDYSEYGLEDYVHYDNMYEAYMQLYIKPLTVLAEMELSGAQLDEKNWPELDRVLKAELEGYTAYIKKSSYYKSYLRATKKENPDRTKKTRGRRRKHRCCSRCGFKEPWSKGDSVDCTRCGASDISWALLAVEPDTYVVDESQPEYVYLDLNVKSFAQVAVFLYDVMKLPDQKNPKDPSKGRSTAKVAFHALIDLCGSTGRSTDRELLETVLAFKRTTKIYDSYVTKLPTYVNIIDETYTTDKVTAPYELDTGRWRIHTNYIQDGAVTGRISSKEPSLHTIPFDSAVKSRFISRFDHGFFVQGDYSQLEIRVLAVLTGDEGLQTEFREGRDIHDYVSSMTFKKAIEDVTVFERRTSKAVTFGTIYGSGAASIAAQASRATGNVQYDLSVADAQDLIDNFFKMMPKVKEWIDEQHDFVRKYRCCISKVGRFRDVSDLVNSGRAGLLGKACRIAVNTPIQGLGSDICLQGLCRVFDELLNRELRTQLFGYVHDSGLLDVPGGEILEVLELFSTEMKDKALEQYPWFNVPLDFDIGLGLSWGRLINTSVEDGNLILEGRLDYFSEIIIRLRKCWRVRVEKFEEFEVEEVANCKAVLNLSDV